MIRRTAAVLMVGIVTWLVVTAPLGGARASTSAPSGAVAVDLSEEVNPNLDEGVLARTGTATLAPMLAVYVGLSLLGAVLAVITAHRRSQTLRATELATGVVARRRGQADFWDVPAPAMLMLSPRSDRHRSRPSTRGALPMLVGSGDAVSRAERRPTVRAGYAEGANDG